MRFQVGDKVRICKNILELLEANSAFGRYGTGWIEEFIPTMENKTVFTIQYISCGSIGLIDFKFTCTENELRLVSRGS